LLPAIPIGWRIRAALSSPSPESSSAAALAAWQGAAARRRPSTQLQRRRNRTVSGRVISRSILPKGRSWCQNLPSSCGALGSAARRRAFVSSVRSMFSCLTPGKSISTHQQPSSSHSVPTHKARRSGRCRCHRSDRTPGPCRASRLQTAMKAGPTSGASKYQSFLLLPCLFGQTKTVHSLFNISRRL
jgi:hypothetical protein